MKRLLRLKICFLATLILTMTACGRKEESLSGVFDQVVDEAEIVMETRAVEETTVVPFTSAQAETTMVYETTVEEETSVEDTTSTVEDEIIMYDLSYAHELMNGLEIPDFLAFASDNQERTSLEDANEVYEGFFSSEFAYGFDLGEPYFQNYQHKVSEYASFLETQGFVLISDWEGYYHFEKQWNGFYVWLAVGAYSYETNGIGISFELQLEPWILPEHMLIT